MLFLFGFLLGFLSAILIVLVLVYFRASIERKLKIVETKISEAGPKQTGSVYVPEDEIIIKRKEIIARNKKEGIDTKLSDIL